MKCHPHSKMKTNTNITTTTRIASGIDQKQEIDALQPAHSTVTGGTMQ